MRIISTFFLTREIFALSLPKHLHLFSLFFFLRVRAFNEIAKRSAIKKIKTEEKKKISIKWCQKSHTWNVILNSTGCFVAEKKTLLITFCYELYFIGPYSNNVEKRNVFNATEFDSFVILFFMYFVANTYIVITKVVDDVCNIRVSG